MTTLTWCSGGVIETAMVPHYVRLLRAITTDLSVRHVLSQAATQFVSQTVLQFLSGNEVYSGQSYLEEISTPAHLAYSDSDIVLIYPASARIIAECALGIISCPVTRVFAFSDKKKVLLVPYLHPRHSDKIYLPHVTRLVEVLGEGSVILPSDRQLFWTGESAWEVTCARLLDVLASRAT